MINSTSRSVTVVLTGRYLWYIYDTTVFVTVIFLSILSFATTLANGFTLYTIYKDPLKCFRTPLAVFITGIVASDFLTGLIVEPIYAKLYSYSFEVDTLAAFLKIVRTAQVLNAVIVNTSFLTVLALAVAQYIALKWPVLYERFITPKKAVIGLIGIWIWAIFFSLLPEITGIQIWTFFRVDLILHNTLITLTLVLIYIATYLVFRKAMLQYSASERAQVSSVNENRQASNTHVEREFIKGTFILTAVLILSVWPFTISLYMLFFGDGYTIAKLIAAVICNNVLFLKFLWDPFIFVWRLPKYRKALFMEFAEICERVGCLRRNPALPGVVYQPRGENTAAGEHVSVVQVTVLEEENEIPKA